MRVSLGFEVDFEPGKPVLIKGFCHPTPEQSTSPLLGLEIELRSLDDIC
nr:hypothetical protein [Dendronalium sp. ChiSLP03b]MDZ8209312.1 hypothetical protein [Dendronalium sp. ChiSLP03b]